MQHSNHQFSNIQIWYSKKLESDFLFCQLDGKEIPARKITAMDVQKIKDGVLSPQQLAERIYSDWIIEPLQKEVEMNHQKPVDKPQLKEQIDDFMDNIDEKLYELVYRMDEEIPGTMNTTKRLASVLKGLAINLYHGTLDAGRWSMDILNRLRHKDYKGIQDELELVRNKFLGLISRTVEDLHLEDVIQRGRTYLKGLYKGFQFWRQGDKSQAQQAITPLADDIKKAVDVTLVQTGISDIAKKNWEQIQSASDNFSVKEIVSSKPEVTFEKIKSISHEAGKDIKSVLMSQPVKNAVGNVISGLEELEKRTRPSSQTKVKEEPHPRLSSISIYTSPNGLKHFVRCKIDGEQQLAREISHKDYLQYKNRECSPIQVAEKYYDKDLAENLSYTKGIKR